MKLRQLVFKLGQVFGIAAFFFIAFVLITEPYHEPQLWIRTLKILGLIVSGIFQAYQLYYNRND